MKVLTLATVLGVAVAQIACSSDSTKGGGSGGVSGTDAGSGGTTASGSGGKVGSGGGGIASSSGGAKADSGTSDAQADSGTPQCPSPLTCVAPTGVYVCENPGPALVTCDKAADCSFGSCYKFSGQGVCLKLCEPQSGLPDSTSISGVVTEMQLGKGFVGTTQPSTEPPLAGVTVCLATPKTNVPCVTTDAMGNFTLTGLPPNRNVAIPVAATVSFKKDGFLSLLRGASLGNGSQVLSPQTRMLTTALGQTIATAVGAKVPDGTTGWLGIVALEINTTNTQRISALTEGNLKELYVDDATFAMTPASGVGPAYAGPTEQFTSIGSDASLDKTSIAGFGYFFNVAAGTYTIGVNHPTLDCGATQKVTAVPGYVYSYIGALCGHGVN